MKYLNPKLYSFFLLKLLVSRASTRSFRSVLNLVTYCTGKITGLTIVPVVWLDEYDRTEVTELRPATQGMAFGPNDDRTSANSFEVMLPKVCRYVLRDVSVTVDSSSFLMKDKLVIERLQTNTGTQVNYNAGQLLFRKDKHAVVRLDAVKTIQKGFFLGGNGSFNYYHWLVELLPKLEFLATLPAALPLLVSEDVNKYASFADTLRILAPGRELIILLKAEQYTVNELYYVTTASNLPFNVDAGHTFKVADFLISLDALAYLRRNLLLEADAQTTAPKRIFLKRDQNRRAYNQDEVEAVLLDHGFVSVACDQLSFAEQVRLFSNAEAIVGPTGAAWTNLVFASAGCKALCWMAKEFNTFSSFSTIAGLTKVDLRYFYYVSGVKSSSALYNTDYHVDIEVFSQCLKDILNATDERPTSIIHS